MTRSNWNFPADTPVNSVTLGAHHGIAKPKLVASREALRSRRKIMVWEAKGEAVIVRFDRKGPVTWIVTGTSAARFCEINNIERKKS